MIRSEDLLLYVAPGPRSHGPRSHSSHKADNSTASRNASTTYDTCSKTSLGSFQALPNKQKGPYLGSTADSDCLSLGSGGNSKQRGITTSSTNNHDSTNNNCNYYFPSNHGAAGGHYYLNDCKSQHSHSVSWDSSKMLPHLDHCYGHNLNNNHHSLSQSLYTGSSSKFSNRNQQQQQQQRTLLQSWDFGETNLGKQRKNRRMQQAVRGREGTYPLHNSLSYLHRKNASADKKRNGRSTRNNRENISLPQTAQSSLFGQNEYHSKSSSTLPPAITADNNAHHHNRSFGNILYSDDDDFDTGYSSIEQDFGSSSMANLSTTDFRENPQQQPRACHTAIGNSRKRISQGKKNSSSSRPHTTTGSVEFGSSENQNNPLSGEFELNQMSNMLDEHESDFKVRILLVSCATFMQYIDFTCSNMLLGIMAFVNYYPSRNLLRFKFSLYIHRQQKKRPSARMWTRLFRKLPTA